MRRTASRGYSPARRLDAARAAVNTAPVIPTTNIQRQQPRPPGQRQEFSTTSGIADQMTRAPSGSIGLASGVPTNAGMTAGGVPRQPDPDGRRPNPGTTGGRHMEDEMGTTNGAAGQSADPYVETDDMFDKLLRELMGNGPRDTAEDEATLRELMAAQTGQGQADLMAGMAAGGFGLSGAAQTGMADIGRRNALSTGRDIIDLRQGARDEWLQRISQGMEGYFGDRGFDQTDREMDLDSGFRDRELDMEEEFRDRGMDLDEAQWEEYMNALEAIYGDIPTPEEQQEIDDSAATNAEMDDIDSVVGGVTGGDDPPPDAANYNEWTGNDPPLGLRTGRDSQYVYIFGLDGKLWKVPAAMYQGS